MNLRWSLPVLVIMAWCLMAGGSFFLHLEPDDISLPYILVSPGWQEWLGYDDLGRAIADRLIMGARTSLLVSVSVAMLSLVSGSIIGVFAAWYGGWCDRISVLVIDIFIAFPGILLAIALSGLLGPGIMNAVIALSVVGWVGFARLARAQTLAVKHRDHISAAMALGSKSIWIALRHVLPLIAAPLVVEGSFAVAGLVIAEASLSFLGLGVQPPDASWGGMIRDGTRYMLIAPHLVLAPGLAVFLVVLSMNFIRRPVTG
jgi:ABC-type dipeptide/oligopeptide/nickel transport systems, permease components